MSIIKKKFRSIKKLPTWIFWFPAMLLWTILHTLYRITIVDPRDVVHTSQGVVGIAWHNRLCFFAAIFPKVARLRTVAVVSASRDGQYICDIISHFGLRSLRGSSSRKGAAAMREAISAIHNHLNVAFTPDGPRGPKYKIKLGPVALASTTGAPVVPISVNASRYWQIKSWDNFQIPKPFAKLTLVFGEPIYVPENLSVEQQEEWRIKVESALLAITED